MVTEGWDGDGSRSDLSQMFNEWWKHCLHCFYLFLFPLFLLLTFNLDQLSCILGRCQCPFGYTYLVFSKSTETVQSADIGWTDTLAGEWKYYSFINMKFIFLNFFIILLCNFFKINVNCHFALQSVLLYQVLALWVIYV